MSSNSQRIETATRQHVGATLTSAQITELVRVSDPNWKGGVYPSDCAGKRQEDGTLTHRGKVAYGDLVVEYVGENNFKVLPTEQIVRRPGSAKKQPAAPTPVPAPAAPVTATEKKKATKSSSQPPAAPRAAKADRHAAH